MSRSRPITDEELKAIQQSVADARHRFFDAHAALCFIAKPGEGAMIDNKLMFRAYKWLLGRWVLPLNQPAVKQLLVRAIEANDMKFFVRLGKILARKPIPMEGHRELTNLQSFLLDHWAESRDELPQLFYLTPAALALVCREKLGLKGLSQDALVKVRKRLRLKPFKRQKRDAVFSGGKWTFPQRDKS